MADSSAYVLDSFALLAYLQDEPIASRVEKLLETAGKEKCQIFLSLINLGELLYIIERRGGVAKAQDALALIQQLPIVVVPANEEVVFAAAHIKANHTLSYADAFVVAVAVQENAIILTGDPEFQTVEGNLKVERLEDPG
jgi:predicted nucleic acid-binding protein